MTPSEMRQDLIRRYGGLTPLVADALARLEKYRDRYNRGERMTQGETDDFVRTRGERALHEALMAARGGYAACLELAERKRAQRVQGSR
jgi:hypothetical protein